MLYKNFLFFFYIRECIVKNRLFFHIMFSVFRALHLSVFQYVPLNQMNLVFPGSSKTMRFSENAQHSHFFKGKCRDCPLFKDKKKLNFRSCQKIGKTSSQLIYLPLLLKGNHSHHFSGGARSRVNHIQWGLIFPNFKGQQL